MTKATTSSASFAVAIIGSILNRKKQPETQAVSRQEPSTFENFIPILYPFAYFQGKGVTANKPATSGNDGAG
jgi:hypothetical protein